MKSERGQKRVYYYELMSIFTTYSIISYLNFFYLVRITCLIILDSFFLLYAY